MATARCYTKSGSVEKYESNLWSMGSFGVAVDITGPDSSGNYTVNPPAGYEDSNTPTEFGCTTYYGGVRKTFYFKEKDTTIRIVVDHKVFGYNYMGCVAFNCSVYGEVNGFNTNTADKIANNILKDNPISLSWKVVTHKGPFGNYTTKITSVGSLILNTWSSYVNGTQYYIDGTPYGNPSSGKYNGVKWVLYVIGGT